MEYTIGELSKGLCLLDLADIDNLDQVLYLHTKEYAERQKNLTKDSEREGGTV